MERYIGVAKGVGSKWYVIILLFYNRMIIITQYTYKHKRPTYYYFNKEQFDFCINEQKLIPFKWFFGIMFNKLRKTTNN